MIDVGALRSLRTVAAVGTLAKAAEELAFTPSAVSQQIKRLEREVGVALLAPAGRGVVLTAAGRALVESSAEVFDALERCQASARSVAEGTATGVVRLAAFSTAIRGLLAPALPGLYASRPQLSVHITEADPEAALHGVDSGRQDLALVHDADGVLPLLPPSVSHLRVHLDAGDVVVPGGHPLAALRRPLGDEDLVGWSWVTSPLGTVCHAWFRRLMARSPHEPDVRHLVDDFSTQLALVAEDGVLALLPRLARPALPRGLAVCELERPPVREVHAVWRRSAEESPSLQAVLEALTTSALTSVS
ncbi:LysR family transcriptional regulator [Quadrisphaera oryzae]|uniref:LysR family transcriptional regulator n=1 Tax=Quadrisphaera TaxID=317661 RepID=UPI0016448308|nr:LysR family transcriptional regulator [Quadrisphaera sp. RL12-1S]MBC3763452.1 LysR family transcriptional regulator [Quadrisphaera sp. RL12-1S]